MTPVAVLERKKSSDISDTIDDEIALSVNEWDAPVTRPVPQKDPMQEYTNLRYSVVLAYCAGDKESGDILASELGSSAYDQVSQRRATQEALDKRLLHITAAITADGGGVDSMIDEYIALKDAYLRSLN